MPGRHPIRERDPGGRPGSRFFVSAFPARDSRPAPARIGGAAALLVGTLLVGATGCVVQERPTDTAPDDGSASTTVEVEDIRVMLDASAASWNAGDLDGFVDDYTDDPALAFVGSSGVTRGIAEVRARYESGYWAGGGPADSLRFEGLELTPLGERHALALGRYVLYRPATDDAPERVTSTGWFSLVVEHDGDRWRIVHDHSSELAGG
jgi:ketosteroid isomerase-like protein